MANFSKKQIDFSRQSLIQRMTRPLPVMALYPRNSSDTQLLIQVINNGTVIALRYISSSTVNESITYVGKSVEDVVQEINKLNIPLEARTIHSEGLLVQGDIISTSEDYIDLPRGVSLYDRLDNNGILLRAKKISIRHKNASRIRVLSPYYQSSSLPWYPRITNGSFSQNYKGSMYHFYITEFDKQSWSITYGKPFKDLQGVQPTIIKSNVYQLPRYPIFWNGQNITIYNGNAPITSTAIEDVDINNGIIYTNPNVYLQEDFKIDYTYLETSFIYTAININGHFNQNPTILDKYVIIYMLPAEGPSGPRKQTVFHTIGDSIDSAIGSITITDPSTPIAIIGAYNIQQYFSSDSISVLDTRVKGGGLKRVNGPVSPIHKLDNTIESDDPEIEDIYSEAYRFWDIGNYDGEAYPGAAAVAIDLPTDLQDVMSLSDIKKKASKYMAAGVYPSISFSERDLPAISGLAVQTSCAYNLSFSDTYTADYSDNGGLLYSTIPNTYKGMGWSLSKYDNPTSILSGDWNSFSGELNIQPTDPSTIQVDSLTGLHMSYLKGSSWAGMSWYERDVIYNNGSTVNPIDYTPWKKVSIYDTKEVKTGQLIKSYLSLSPTEGVKQYKDVTIHSPYLTGNLISKVKSGISSILDTIFELQSSNGVTTNSTEIISSYNKVGDKTSTTLTSPYLTASPLYKHIYNLENTDLEDVYSEQLFNIGNDFLERGIYDSGHFYKAYLPDYGDFVQVGAEVPYLILDFNQPMRLVNDYLNYRHRMSLWSGLCDSGTATSTGAAVALHQSTSYSGPFEYGVPLYFVYYPANPSEGYPTSYYSGIYFNSPLSTTGTVTDVSPDSNYDYLYNFSLPAFVSTCVANSGEVITNPNVTMLLTGVYDLAVQNTIEGMQTALYSERTLSGLPTTTHWFVGHNRLGTHLGNNLFKLIESYEYVRKYNTYRSMSRDVSTPVGCSQEHLTYMFSGIEHILDVGYDAVYHNLLRGGIVEPDVSLTIYAYGWYLNNFNTNYGLASKTYFTDYRSKFETLFTNGLKQLVKNTFTPEGEMLETTTVYGEIGPFTSSTVSKLLYPLAEGLKYDYSTWAGPSEGVITTLIEEYGQDGLYYLDPYKYSDAAGKEIDVLGGLIEVYKAIAQTGTSNLWEPVNTGLSNIRSTEFLSTYNNSIDLWVNYETGLVDTSISLLKGIGINTVDVPLDYIYWKLNSGDLHTKFDSFLSICNEHNMRVIPSLLNGDGLAVQDGNESLYIGTYASNSSKYYYAPVSSAYFITGEYSGQQYVESFVSGYDKDPAIIAWSIVDKARVESQAKASYNSVAYLIKEITSTPVIYNIGSVLGLTDINPMTSPALDEISPDTYVAAYPSHPDDIYASTAVVYNPNIDIVGITPNGLYGYFIDVLTGIIPKPVVLNRYSNGTYENYSLATSYAAVRNIPIGYSDLFVKSGSSLGTLYTDGKARNIIHVNSIKSLAINQGADPTGLITQEKNFNNKYFYPTGYVATYDSRSLTSEIANWSSRDISSPFNTGEIYRQIQLLQTLHSGLDTLNYKNSWPTSQYVVPQVLLTTECDDLTYFNSTWNTVSFFEGTGSAWLLDGELDYSTYNEFISEWGSFLYTVSNRLSING